MSRLGIIIPSDDLDRLTVVYRRLEGLEILTDTRYAPVVVTRNPNVPKLRPKSVVSPMLPGVNAMWGTALGAILGDEDVSWVMFLNDDVEFRDDYFAEVYKWCMELGTLGLAYTDIVGLCPCTFNRSVFHKLDNHRTLYQMTKREGWAFTLRRDFLERCPGIPDDLVYFYGDDWYWFHSQRAGYTWMYMNNITVRHAVGSTTKQDLPRFRAIRKHEYKIYRKHINQYEER